jgi:hypothetical protein
MVSPFLSDTLTVVSILYWSVKTCGEIEIFYPLKNVRRFSSAVYLRVDGIVAINKLSLLVASLKIPETRAACD